MPLPERTPRGPRSRAGTARAERQERDAIFTSTIKEVSERADKRAEECHAIQREATERERKTAEVLGLVLTPLARTDKTETIDDAHRIGTYEPSVLHHPDCCSFLVAEHPATKALLHEVEAMEESIAWGALLKEAIQGTEVRVSPRAAGSP